MPEYLFNNVKIQAASNDEANKIMTALFDLKKSMTTADLILFAAKVKAKPGLIQKAKMFI